MKRERNTDIFRQNPELEVSRKYEETLSSQLVGSSNINSFEIKDTAIKMLTILDSEIPVTAVLTGIDIKTSPYKTDYTEGETYEDEGTVVVAYYDGTFRDGTKRTVTKTIKNYSVDTKTSLRPDDESWKYSYTENGITAEAYQSICVEKFIPVLVSSTLKKITVSKNPKKTEYVTGESFSSKGMVVKATYVQRWNDSTTKTVTSKIKDYTVDAPLQLSPEDKSVTVTYSYEGVTAKAKVKVDVKDADPFISEKKKSMYQGEVFELKVLGTDSYTMWKSSNTNVVTVDKNGKVKAVGIGKATITATVGSGKNNKKFSCAVTVKSRLKLSSPVIFLALDQFGELNIMDATIKKYGTVSVTIDGKTASMDTDKSGNYIVVPETPGVSVINAIYTIPDVSMTFEATVPVIVYSGPSFIELFAYEVNGDGYLTLYFALGYSITVKDRDISTKLRKYIVEEQNPAFVKKYEVNQDKFEALLTKAAQKGLLSVMR